MRFKYAGNKRDGVLITVQNNEVSATLQLGQPVMYSLSGTAATDDGLDVVNPSTALTANYQLCAGVLATGPLAANQYGESIVYGYCPSTLVRLSSRASSTDSWSSIAAVASGVLLVPDFTSNIWGAIANVAAASSPQCILLDAIASFATLVSNAGGAGDTRTVSTGLRRSFVRML